VRLRRKTIRCELGWALRAILAAFALAASVPEAAAQSLSADDLRILSRVLGFMQPPPVGEIAIAYAAGNPASRADAEAIARLIGDGLSGGLGRLRPRLTEIGGVAASGAKVVIAAAGANGAALGAAIRAAGALCVTNDLAPVQAGHCTVAIRREPRVEIIVNHAAAAAAGIEFATAFRMMIREI
jgi:hypothetical protein